MRRLLPVLLLVPFAAAPLFAHHSFSAYYFEDRSVTVTGEVVAFDYRSPHAWVHVSAPDADGVPRRYGAEWANPNRLGRQGVQRDTLRPGDRVVIVGSPGRAPGEYKLHLKRIERPSDGWSWRGGRRR